MTMSYRTDIHSIASRLAQMHAESPEVRAAGGPEEADAATFERSVLDRELTEIGQAGNEIAHADLRDALALELGRLERAQRT
jgi:hypothetical protein